MKILTRPAARDDVLRQYRYLLFDEDSPTAAERFLERVESTVRELRRRPKLGKPIEIKNIMLRGLRSWPVEGFPPIRIYYMVSEKAVEIVRVLHGKRDISPLLEL